MNWTMQSLMQAGNARKREMCMHRLRYGQTLVNFSVYATGLDEDRFEYDPSLLLGQRLESRQCICVNELELLQCEQFLQLDWCAGCADERNVFDRGWSTNCLNFWCARLLVYLSLFPSLSRAAKSICAFEFPKSLAIRSIPIFHERLSMRLIKVPRWPSNQFGEF